MPVSEPLVLRAEDRNTAARVELTDAITKALERLRGAAPEPEVIALHVSSAFELVRFHAGRPLFAVRGTTPRAGEPDLEASDAAPPGPAALPPPHEPAPNLFGQIQGLARTVFPIDRGRHRWLVKEMTDLGYRDPTLATLSLLDQEDLAVILRRLRARVSS